MLCEAVKLRLKFVDLGGETRSTPRFRLLLFGCCPTNSEDIRLGAQIGNRTARTAAEELHQPGF